MTKAVFFEKPGCINNTKQKKLLIHAGFRLLEKNILEFPWEKEYLMLFLQGAEVNDWFNPSAPRVKSGEIDPSKIDKKTALEQLIADPLLIRRPLIQIDNHYLLGFDSKKLQQLTGLVIADTEQDLETCSTP